MSIPYEHFLNWACEHFGAANVEQRGPEICINSPFVGYDDGYHLQCRPEINAFHCWKSNAKGNLYQLVMDMEGCAFPDAKDILGGDQYLYKLEQKLEKFFEQKYKESQQSVIDKSLSLPPDTFSINSLKGRWRQLAENYLEKRKIPIDGLCFCLDGKYKNRIIIPYYGPKGNLIYFNARDITGQSKVRYRGPEKEVGIGKGDVVWMKAWPKEGEMIYLTEGEFDAMSLCLAGFNGAACGGKNFSEKQFELVKPYQITICFDLDKYGLEALNKVGAFMRSKQFVRGAKYDQIGYIRPPQGYKDWNDMLVQLDKDIVRLYVEGKRQPLTWGDSMKMRFNAF
jgi:DNA primase